jgi:hypothetical protein
MYHEKSNMEHESQSKKTQILVVWCSLLHEDLVFVVNVMVIDMMQETMVSNVISRPTCVAVEFSAIVKIFKYKGFHKGHHFISMAMEVHGTLKCDMDCFKSNVSIFFTIDGQEVIYPCLFTFNFLGNELVFF